MLKMIDGTASAHQMSIYYTACLRDQDDCILYLSQLIVYKWAEWRELE